MGGEGLVETRSSCMNSMTATRGHSEGSPDMGPSLVSLAANGILAEDEHSK